MTRWGDHKDFTQPAFHPFKSHSGSLLILLVLGEKTQAQGLPGVSSLYHQTAF